MTNKRHHYVPQFYLKQFRGDGTDRVLVCLVQPYRSVGLGTIRGQCQSDHFYGKDGVTDAMLQETEKAMAPTLYAVNQSRTVTAEQWQGLRMLAVQLHLRTNKAAELAKAFPRFAANQMITAAIQKGELPEPKDGWRPDMMDFDNVPQTLLGLNLLSCYFETTTLRGKLLSAPAGTFFITSDNPAVALNQFAADAKGPRDYVGFAQSGFQLLLPLSPSLCALLYDPFVYKVGARNDEVIALQSSDVELVNSLQVQSAEQCLYAHGLHAELEVARVVARYAQLRKPNSEAIKSYPQNAKETLFKFGNPAMVIPRKWGFCGYLKHIQRRVGDRRDPGYTHLIRLLVEDYENNPGVMEIEQRLDRVTANLPDQMRLPRRADFHGVRMPGSPHGWKLGM